jgi:transposase-like protein
MKKALKRHGSPEAITTDGLRSYKAAMTELGNRHKQEVGRWANNRVENSHLSFRRRERAMGALEPVWRSTCRKQQCLLCGTSPAAKEKNLLF